MINGYKLVANMKEMIKALELDYIKVFEVHTGVITGKVKFMDYRYRYL